MFNNWADKMKKTEKAWLNKVNGYGVLFRFIMPAMIAIIGWQFQTGYNDIKKTQDFMRGDIKILDKKIDMSIAERRTYFENHLEHHQVADKEIEKRMTRIETLLEKKR